jgi:hypothetical protein
MPIREASRDVFTTRYKSPQLLRRRRREDAQALKLSATQRISDPTSSCLSRIIRLTRYPAALAYISYHTHGTQGSRALFQMSGAPHSPGSSPR